VPQLIFSPGDDYPFILPISGMSSKSAIRGVREVWYPLKRDPGGTSTTTRSSIATPTRLTPRRRRFPLPPAGFVSLACSMPEGLIEGEPFSPFSHAMSARNAATSALNADIFAAPPQTTA